MKRIMAKYIHEEIKGKLKRYIDYEVIGSSLLCKPCYISGVMFGYYVLLSSWYNILMGTKF